MSAISTLRAFRASFQRSSALRASLQEKFHHPVPTAPLPRPQAPISCLRVPDILSLTRLAADDIMTESLHAWRKLARQHATTRQNAMASIGDTLVFFRSEVRDINLARVARRLLRRRRSTGAGIVTRVNSRLLNASAGMGLAAVVAREQRDAGPESLLRILSSTEGPHRIGVGTLPPALRNYLAWLFGYLTAMCTSILIFMHPQAIPWLIVTAAVCFATRPDLDSFSAWTRRCAPLVAAQKTMLLDKLRATVAPYFMSLRPPVLSDYGLFSIVTLIDHADYVYVYAGFLSRWCLLGWYNMADDYNFDKIYLVTKS